MDSSTASSELIKALLAARVQVKNPPLDSENPHFRSKFSSLKAVVEHTVEVALKHGLCVIGDPQKAEGGIDMYTVLAHESGEVMRFGPMFFPCTKHDAQGYASALTYARRYHLMSIFNVVGDVDDDGNAATASSFDSKKMKAKYYDGLKAAAAEEDGLKARELWGELNSEQQMEVWGDLKQSSRVRSTIKRLLSETNEESE